MPGITSNLVLPTGATGYFGGHCIALLPDREKDRRLGRLALRQLALDGARLGRPPRRWRWHATRSARPGPIACEASGGLLAIKRVRYVVPFDWLAHLAVANDQLFVRELNALTAWQWRQDKLQLN